LTIPNSISPVLKKYRRSPKNLGDPPKISTIPNSKSPIHKKYQRSSKNIDDPQIKITKRRRSLVVRISDSALTTADEVCPSVAQGEEIWTTTALPV
jgi:hypothetical protein